MRVFADLDEFAAAEGERIGPGEWQTVTQEQVNTFADATDDHQWIHVDPERAAAGPFGGTIAHGYLTLSLIPMLAAKLYRVDGVSMGINYGLNKVRFPHAVPVGARIRAIADLLEVTDAGPTKQSLVRWTIEIDGVDKPACVAEMLARFTP